MSLRVSLVLTTWFLGVNAYSQADSLEVDSLFLKSSGSFGVSKALALAQTHRCGMAWQNLA